MKLFTSNFRRSGQHPGAVAISNGQGFYWHVPQYRPLVPAWKLVRDSKAGLIERQAFDREYLAQLHALDPRRVLFDLAAFGPEVVLLCWEKPGDYCHRRLAAQWLETEFGIAVPELPKALW
jgi:uncharacterized protein (DUF488 family)